MSNLLPFLSQARTWNAFYGEPRVAEFRRRLYLEAFGEEYPAEEATDGYITRSELQAMAKALRVGPGQKIADLGCGRGGPGQWIASATGTALVGIDFSEVALEQARARARAASPLASSTKPVPYATRPKHAGIPLWPVAAPRAGWPSRSRFA